MSAIVELLQITKTFPGVVALKDVDLSLRPGSIHALVGENGAGKSTLINLLSGVLQPDSGEIRIGGQARPLTDAHSARRQGIVTVHQELDLFPDLSVAENMGLEQGLATTRFGWIDWRRQREQARQALRAVGEDLRPDSPAGRLSPAQRQLVEIAAALSQAAKLLILDEPTSSLSRAETEVLFGHLRRFRARGAAVLYVTHRLEEVFLLADEVTVLRDGRHIWTGPVGQSTPQHLIALMVGREKRTECEVRSAQCGILGTPQSALPIPHSPRPTCLACRGLTAVDKSFKDITLEVHPGEILGIYGLVGAGRSEWAQALFGLRELARGEVWLDGRPVCPRNPGQMIQSGLAYVPEDRLRQGLCRGLSVRANVVLPSLRQLARRLWLLRAEEIRRTRTAVDQLAIRLTSLEQGAGTLSGGNQQKVVLGRWLGRDPRILLLDEPTRGVDVGAKAEIHALIRRLAREGRAIVLISSDLPEVLDQSDRIAVFREGRLAGTFDPALVSAAELATAALPVHRCAIKPDGMLPVTDGDGQPLQQMPLIARLGHCVLDLIQFREASLALLLLLLFGFLEWHTGRYLQPGNLRDLAIDTALLAFCATGAMLVILTGAIDISLGALMALSAAIAGTLWARGTPLPVAVGLAILIGGAGGLLNASLSLAGKVHPIVITLGTLTLYRGLIAWWMSENLRVPLGLRQWLVDPVLGLPAGAWAGAALLLLTAAFLNYTVLGREFYALGSNPAAAHRVGIERGRVWLKAFTLQGMLAGLAAFLYLARSGGLERNSFDDTTLQAIAAAVVGGVAITGGRGTVWGVALGCVLLVVLPNACTFLDISPTWQRTLVGAVLVIAVSVDGLWGRNRLAT
jgi:ABC-type sugar transport system ATPase subunit/ribose/xylose/arabinose/galactoside ABC-type transport system permease subunit